MTKSKFFGIIYLQDENNKQYKKGEIKMSDVIKEEKKTKVKYFQEIADLVAASDAENKDELVTFVEGQIEKLNEAAKKAAKRRAEKAEAPDEILIAVENAITTEPKTAQQIADEIGGEVTKAKVVARITKLGDKVVKQVTKTENGKVTVYTKA